MLLVLNNVNDNMHQIGITGFHVSYSTYFKFKKKMHGMFFFVG